MKELRAYMAHGREACEGACLVFAHTSKEARRMAFPTVHDWHGCEYIDVRTQWLKDDQYLRQNEADQVKLAKGLPHVIESPTPCTSCELWYEELVDGWCHSCHPEHRADAQERLEQQL